MTEAELANMRPASEVLPQGLYGRLVARCEALKTGEVEAVVLHLDPETAARLRAEGADWEERAGSLLRTAVGL